MTKHIEARMILETTGNEEAAWEVAKTDEGMLEGVTKGMWLAFARNCIAREAAEKAAYANAYYA